MVRSDVVGTWKLISFELEDSKGVRKNWGNNVRGRVIYTDSGHVSVAINKDIEPSPDGEAQDTLDAMLFYSGTFSVTDKEIHHTVDLASDPSRVGRTLERFAVLRGNVLELISPPQSFGHAIVRWEKVSQ